ncbi:unnamed protein product [Parnassius apollo]|uniref:(apollo) hypothetical protein n=1 Tax=Parnassius apollo TaxID=110799 RepID=A0A8S3WD30_PARAO|nr:unnamed protein product [Parnassius apollo]
MEDLCTTCLCVGRNLVFIGETGCYNLYCQILSEIEVYDTSVVCVRVCWECRVALRNFQRFKVRAQRCYTELLEHIQQQDNSQKLSLCKDSSLKIQHVLNISYPETVKVESDQENVTVENIKTENLESDIETHCEPETFVRDLKLESPKVKKESIKKTTKKRIKKKVKKKKPKSNTPTYISESEHWSDNNEDNETAQNLEEKLLEENKEIVSNPCDTEIEFGDGLENHLKEKHASPPHVNGTATRAPRSREVLPDRPQCVECGKIFSSKKTYRYHLNVLHKGQNSHQCPRCGKVYQWKSNLGRHMRTHKARDSGELHCDVCDKAFASVATYRQHLRISRKHVPETEFR